jgi:hypothetical protein
MGVCNFVLYDSFTELAVKQVGLTAAQENSCCTKNGKGVLFQNFNIQVSTKITTTMELSSTRCK